MVPVAGNLLRVKNGINLPLQNITEREVIPFMGRFSSSNIKIFVNIIMLCGSLSSELVAIQGVSLLKCSNGFLFPFCATCPDHLEVPHLSNVPAIGYQEVKSQSSSQLMLFEVGVPLSVCLKVDSSELRSFMKLRMKSKWHDQSWRKQKRLWQFITAQV